MDADRFDAFARALSSTLPRRRAMVATLGTALAALLADAVGDVVAKKRKHKRKRRKKKCRGSQQRCGKRCVDLATDPQHCGACGSGCPTGECLNGACTCLDADDCDECICVNRKEGGKACASASAALEACLNDLRCRGLGGFCGETEPGVFRCTIPCPKKA